MEVEVLASAAIVLAAATVQGLTGFGFALVCVPVLMLFLDPKTVVVTVLLLSTLLNVLMLLQARRYITLQDAGPITLGSILGVPFGTYLLLMLSPDSLRVMVALLALGFSIPLLIGYSHTFRHPLAASLLIGGVSGALHSSTSMGGPPVVLFMANQGVPKEVFRGTMTVRSIATSFLSVVVLLPSGLISGEVLREVALLAPLLFFGWAAGSRLLGLVPQGIFKKLTVLVISLTSLAGILSTIRP